MRNLILTTALLATLAALLTPVGTAMAEGSRADDTSIISLNLENDLYGSGSDRGYTSGVRLGYMSLKPEIPDILRRLVAAIPTIDINESTALYYSLGQDLFTPDDISKATVGPRDRPWAAFLYASAGMATMTKNRKDEIELSLGVVGPAALGKPVQSFIHKHITDSPAPQGWGTQLNNEPILMLGWQRSWMNFAGGNIGGLYWNVAPHIGVTLGNAYTFADGGLTASIGPRDAFIQDTPVRARPAIPGTGYFDRPENMWGWYIFGGVDTRVMGRNIFLDGNTFTDSHSVNKKTFVTDLNAGLAFTFKSARLTYTLVHRTREYDEQDAPSTFGAISLSYRF